MRLALSWASPGGSQGKLSILIFHRVLPAPDPLFPGEVDRARFDRICSWLRGWFNVLPLELAYQRLLDGSLPERALAITFDDGYRDNAEIAMPVLQAHGLTATFFVATGYLDDGCMWNDKIIEAIRHTRREHLDTADLVGGCNERLSLASIDSRRAAISTMLRRAKYLEQRERLKVADAALKELSVEQPRDLMLQKSQLCDLSRGGMSVGAHTVSHPILALCEESHALSELRGSKAAIEALLQVPVRLLAYPNGVPGDDISEREPRLAREAGYLLAVTTRWGYSTASSNPFMLPRFSPWDQDRLGYGIRMIRNLSFGESR
jgi:peptidoglycan/xylan/chitin deacetylase (PgdA/CDA1 family)